MTALQWGTDAISLDFTWTTDAPVALAAVAPADHVDDRDGGTDRAVLRRQPLVEVFVVGDGHALTATRLTYSGVGSRLRHVDDARSTHGGEHELRIRQRDEGTGLVVVTVLRAHDGVPAVQTWTEIENAGTERVVVQAVSSFASSALLPESGRLEDVALFRARSEWTAESRWARIPLAGPDGLPQIDVDLHGHDPRGALVTVSRSTWSSGEYAPTGVLVDERRGRAWAWQIEHNGAWHWELDNRRDDGNGVGVILTGPNDLDHQWSITLEPGRTFTSVPVSIAVSDHGFDGAIAALTAQRRAIRLDRAVDAGVPVVFNDYMNALMGDPTTERLLPLIDSAAAAGAEYFCIDAGWYDDGGDWWPSVGAWQPSTVRFPDGGIERVLDHIRSRGMQPGLWLEPEVIGVLSPVADELPDDAFLQRQGIRIVEHDRYQLDLRHPAAVAHLDETVDRLVTRYGVRFFKLDYNVTPGAGTDLDAISAGDGLLQHNRAHLAWLDGILERHPDVIFENCGSGAMRMDYAMLSRLDLQSTSDQQDPLAYAPIAAAAPASVLPEQAGNWAYPQGGMSAELTAFCMVNGLAGRMYLSGRLDHMESDQFALVSDAVRCFQGLRTDLRTAVPFWPIGLPEWEDGLVVLGYRTPTAELLVVWSRRPDGAPVSIPLPRAGGTAAVGTVEELYPVILTDWAPTLGPEGLTLTPPAGEAAARVFRISTETA